jgi:pyruvate kinase
MDASDMDNRILPAKKTKIVATIGPASESREVLQKLIASGMDVARVNFSHGNLEKHAQVIANIRAVAAEMGKRVAIMGDLPGPKMRIGQLAQEPIQLERGQPFIIQTTEIMGDAQRVSMSFAELPRVVKPGDAIYINDGYIQLEVEKVVGDEVYTWVRVGGELRSRKGVNFPGIDLGICAFTERDRECLQFAAGQKLDAVSQSFVQDAGDILAVRQAAAEFGYEPFVIAKIERAKALENLDEILQSTDGIMVARGDLGVEVPFERVAMIQKDMIHKANLYGKPVITATHMLESMINNRRPTRAEVTDVSNAILDGTDCLMLSGETSIGQFPDDAVSAMADIASFTEQSKLCGSLTTVFESEGHLTQRDHVALGLFLMVEKLGPDLIFAMTTTGATARLLARFRPGQWIVAISQEEKTCQELLFTYGVYPFFEPKRADKWSCYVADWIQHNQLDVGMALLTEGGNTLKERDTTLVEIINLV